MLNIHWETGRGGLGKPFRCSKPLNGAEAEHELRFCIAVHLPYWEKDSLLHSLMIALSVQPIFTGTVKAWVRAF